MIPWMAAPERELDFPRRPWPPPRRAFRQLFGGRDAVMQTGCGTGLRNRVRWGKRWLLDQRARGIPSMVSDLRNGARTALARVSPHSECLWSMITASWWILLSALDKQWANRCQQHLHFWDGFICSLSLDSPKWNLKSGQTGPLWAAALPEIPRERITYLIISYTDKQLSFLHNNHNRWLLLNLFILEDMQFPKRHVDMFITPCSLSIFHSFIQSTHHNKLSCSLEILQKAQVWVGRASGRLVSGIWPKKQAMSLDSPKLLLDDNSRVRMEFLIWVSVPGTSVALWTGCRIVCVGSICICGVTRTLRQAHSNEWIFWLSLALF